MNFDLLPIEIKCHIFSFLPFKDLYFKVPNVCKQWQSLTSDPHVVKYIVIDERFDSEEITQCLTNYNLARYLKFDSVETSAWILEIPINNNLRRLHFENFYFDFTSLPFLSTRFPMISSVKISDCMYDCHGLDYETTPAEVFSFRNITAHCLQLFAENCQRLEEVTIDFPFSIDERSFQTLINLQGTTLKKICLRGFALTDDNFTALSQCPRIVDLELFDLDEMTDSQLLSLKKLRSLSKLSLLGAIRVSANAFAQLFTESIFPDLHSINLQRSTNLSDDVIVQIAKSYPNLKSLDIANCYEITNIGVKSVVDNCSVLESLDLLSNGNITEDILELIISRLPHLKYLNVVGCDQITVTRSRRLQLTTLNPKLLLNHSFDSEYWSSCESLDRESV